MKKENNNIRLRAMYFTTPLIVAGALVSPVVITGLAVYGIIDIANKANGDINDKIGLIPHIYNN